MRSRRSPPSSELAELTAGAQRLARIGGIAVPTTLAALAALHAAWALGWRWPGGSDPELARRVVSSRARMTSR